MAPTSDSEDCFQLVTHKKPVRLAKKKRLAEKALSSQSSSDCELNAEPISTAKLIHQAIAKLQQAVQGEKNADLKAKLATQVQNLQKILTNQDITSDNGEVKTQIKSLQTEMHNKFAVLQSSIDKIATKVASGAEVRTGCCHGHTDIPKGGTGRKKLYPNFESFFRRNCCECEYQWCPNEEGKRPSSHVPWSWQEPVL